MKRIKEFFKNKIDKDVEIAKESFMSWASPNLPESTITDNYVSHMAQMIKTDFIAVFGLAMLACILEVFTKDLKLAIGIFIATIIAYEGLVGYISFFTISNDVLFSIGYLKESEKYQNYLKTNITESEKDLKILKDELKKMRK